jgi:hypothetical protein
MLYSGIYGFGIYSVGTDPCVGPERTECCYVAPTEKATATQKLRLFTEQCVFCYRLHTKPLTLFGDVEAMVMKLNQAGKMIEERLLYIANNSAVTLDKYCIMPNHIHAIIIISWVGPTRESVPTISEMIQRFKTITTKLYIDGVRSGIYPPFKGKYGKDPFMIISYEMNRATLRHGSTSIQILSNGKTT